jgi:hypothetical protein
MTKDDKKEPKVSQEVHDYLSNVGRKGSSLGGQIAQKLIELGKQKYEEDTGQSWHMLEEEIRKQQKAA